MTSAQATHNALFDEFLAWCAMHDIVVDDEAVTFAARSSEGGGGGRGVLCGTRDLGVNRVLARIPVSMCLTLSTCGMPDVAEAIHAKVVEQKLLAGWLCEAASALCVERHLGRASKYFAYIRVLPDCEPNVVSMWSDEERGYLVNTEVEVGLRDELREARREWDCIVEEVFKAHDVKCSFDLFHRARTVVSSRAFQISPTCGIGLAPIADCFNHRTGGHDVNIGDGGGSVSTSENDALGVRIVREGGVKSGEEIFNTYGFLGNARLLNSYGFTQRDNPADVVSLSTTNIRVAAAMVGISGSQIAKRFEWIESASLISSADSSFDINRACTLPDDLMYVVWACVEDDDIFRKVRHTARRDDAINAIVTVAKAMEGAHEQQPMMTCSVVKVISSAIERRLSMYVTVGDEERRKNERLECAATLIESERQILKGVLEKLEKFSVSVSADEGSNKRAKSGGDAFALFD